MPRDPERHAEAAAWLTRAHADLQAADLDLAANPPLVEDALFHCQQAVEKALKSLLTAHERMFRKTHDLVELGRSSCEAAPELEPLLARAAPLTEYAWAYRYPGEWVPPEPDEGHEALEVARQVVSEVERRLSG